MKFAKYTFFVSGIYGLLVLLPNYFLEVRTSVDNPPITHPEFYYGFIGLASVFQIVFLLISRDPIRYRPLMVVSVLEKLSFGLLAALLYLNGRLDGPFFLGGMIDLFLAVLFAISFVVTAKADDRP
ncbi:MAG: hypothetical protein ABI791_08175 [Acidobacteriota bacterium]